MPPDAENVMTKKKRQLSLTDHMVLTGFGLAIVYWLFESFISIFFSLKIDFFEVLVGNQSGSIWTRVIVLCLFVIFGSHAQYTIRLRDQAQQELRKSEERYRTLVENIPIGIFRLMPGWDGQFLMANPAFLSTFGYGAVEELKGVTGADIFFSPDDYNLFSDNLLKWGRVDWIELQFKKKDGARIWGLVTGRVVHTEADNAISYFDCTLRDITEQKEAEKRIEEEAETRRRFQRLLSPDLAEMVVAGQLRVELGGESREATVLFADIRNFTALSENTSAPELLQMLNEFFEVLVEIVFEYEGSVDKFIGDAIMVNWGAPLEHDDDPMRAVRAALNMQAAVSDYNKKRRADGKGEISIGVGINTGNLVAGYIGSTRTMSYSVIGPTVNTASRLCAAAKPGQIIVSENTFSKVYTAFKVEELEPIVTKGHDHTTRIFNVVQAKSG